MEESSLKQEKKSSTFKNFFATLKPQSIQETYSNLALPYPSEFTTITADNNLPDYSDTGIKRPASIRFECLLINSTIFFWLALFGVVLIIFYYVLYLIIPLTPIPPIEYIIILLSFIGLMFFAHFFGQKSCYPYKV